jgi:hypothetical protein
VGCCCLLGLLLYIVSVSRFGALKPHLRAAGLRAAPSETLRNIVCARALENADDDDDGDDCDDISMKRQVGGVGSCREVRPYIRGMVGRIAIVFLVLSPKIFASRSWINNWLCMHLKFFI